MTHFVLLAFFFSFAFAGAHATALPQADQSVGRECSGERETQIETDRGEQTASSVEGLTGAANDLVEDLLTRIRDYDELMRSANALQEKAKGEGPLVTILGEMVRVAVTERAEVVEALKAASLLSGILQSAGTEGDDAVKALRAIEPRLDEWRQLFDNLGFPAPAPAVPEPDVADP